MVTPDIVSDVLHVLRVVHPDYPGYERLRTVSKDELITGYRIPIYIYEGKNKMRGKIYSKML